MTFIHSKPTTYGITAQSSRYGWSSWHTSCQLRMVCRWVYYAP